MLTALYLYVLLVVPTLLLAILRRFMITNKHDASRCALMVIRDFKTTKDILHGRGIWPSKLPLIVEARSKSNERLVRVFQIENSFTTMDTKYHKEFLHMASQRISPANGGDLKALGERAREAVQRSWSHLQNKHNDRPLRGCLPLVPLIQSAVLGTILITMFPTDWDYNMPVAEQQLTLLKVAELIDSLWITSKATKRTCTKSTPNLGNDYQQLHAALQNLLPTIGNDAPSRRQNPLNLILPAYETLWRLVLMCLLETRFRNSAKPQREAYHCPLKTFLDNPSTDSFKARSNGEVSCADIINEALRLYPPTKRIYRQMPSVGGGEEVQEVAMDIEYLHRDVKIWGSQALLFWPSRWSSNMSDETRQYFMPFGAGKTVCPARTAFGPHVAALLLATLLEKCIAETWELDSMRGKECLNILSSDIPLRNERGALSELCLCHA